MALSLVLTAVLLLLRQSITGRDVHPGGSRGGDGGVSYCLLPRHPLHHGVQHHQLHLPGTGRQQKSHVLHRHCLRGQHRSGLFLHGRAPIWGRWAPRWAHAVAGCQRGDLADCDSPVPNRNFRHSRRPTAPAGRNGNAAAAGRSHCRAGRTHSGSLPHHHDHRQPPGPQ